MITYDGKYAYVTFHTMSGHSKKKENFVAEPSLLQLHPKNSSSKIVKIHFAEQAPKWMKHFAQKHSYTLDEFQNGEQVGFSLTLERTSEKVTVSPLIKGMIHEWFNNLNESMNHLKDTLLSNSEVVEFNLYNRTSFFEELGLYFCLEEFEKKTGALCYENWVPPYHVDFEDMALDKQEEWLTLIQQLTLPGEIPPIENESGKECRVNNECKDGNNFEDEHNDKRAHSDGYLVTSEEIKIEIEEAENVIENHLGLSNESVNLSNDIIIGVSNDVTLLNLDNLDIEIIDEYPVEVDIVVETEQQHAEPVIEIIEDTKEIDLNIATFTSKKEGIVEGQTLLF